MAHSCLRVLELERTLKFYSLAFGLHEVARYTFESFTLCYLRAQTGNFELELTVNHGRTKPYQLGEGYGHLALLVDDLALTLQRYNDQTGDQAKITQLHHNDVLLGEYFFATDPDGYKIEVLSKTGRFQNF